MDKKELYEEIILPDDWPTNISNMSREKLNEEIEKGIADYQAKRVKPLKKISEDYPNLKF